MHPADEIRGSKSKILSKKRIVLAVTGSIAAVETIKLSRELIRHGAEVIPVMSPSATKIIHPDSIWFATGNKPIIELTGATEHVSFCGRVKNPADLLLICPSTANTISKIAHGIDDTPVTTFATTAIGSGVPILIVPAMHLSMYDHKIIQENIKKCKEVGIKFIDPFIEKNKAKMVDINEIIAYTIRETGTQDLAKKKILVIGGPTAESIDDVRIITNRSSGKTAVSLALNAFYRGADVELWYGIGKESPPDYIKTVDFESINDLLKLVKTKDLKKFDIIILCAAISDYIPKKQKGKISSGKDKLIIEMSPAPKIISSLRKKGPKSKIIGYKVEENTVKLKEKAKDLIKKNNLDFVVANTISTFNKDKNEIWIIDKKGKCIHKKGDKKQLAGQILDTIK
ncbi:MAG: bifunctional phosphopantothenoylcysteine decarboxylase/phosphopantothenate--cysteine ligase CoaBC [Thermoplasmatales archaeon]|nr:bifunctional phosphopantothenoylcysteine decarboxylase/phosphopantothenate--cysteine ligase CoaBC [Thermoplasmatales archaeon]